VGQPVPHSDGSHCKSNGRDRYQHKRLITRSLDRWTRTFLPVGSCCFWRHLAKSCVRQYSSGCLPSRCGISGGCGGITGRSSPVSLRRNGSSRCRAWKSSSRTNGIGRHRTRGSECESHTTSRTCQHNPSWNRGRVEEIGTTRIRALQGRGHNIPVAGKTIQNILPSPNSSLSHPERGKSLLPSVTERGLGAEGAIADSSHLSR
jgi:hypothetical protein